MQEFWLAKNRRPIKMTGNSSLLHALIADWSTIFAGLCRSKILAQGYFGSSIEISSTARWLSDRNRKSVVLDDGLLQPVYRHRVLLVPHLEREELVVAVNDSIGTCEGCLERGLSGIGADEYELGLEQAVWDVGLGRSVSDGRDRSEVFDLLT